MTQEAQRAEFLALINRTPLLQSVLYDFNLMPEQTQPGSLAYDTMLAFAFVYQAAQNSAPDPSATSTGLSGYCQVPESFIDTMRRIAETDCAGACNLDATEVVRWSRLIASEAMASLTPPADTADTVGSNAPA